MKTKHILLLVLLAIMLACVFVVSASAADTTTKASTTAYAAIPDEFADVDAYPFAIYRGGTFVTATPYLNGETDEYALYYVSSRIGDSQSYEILMRRDYTTTTTNTKLGAIYYRSNVTLDLDGHTLTLGATMYYVDAQDPVTDGKAITITTKNGNVEVGSNLLCAVSDYYKRKTFNIVFENVKFNNIQGTIISDNAFKNDSDDRNHSNYYIYFNSCDLQFNFTTWVDVCNFGYGNARSVYRPIYVYFNGGSIDYLTANAGYFASIGNNCASAKKFFFGADANGNYTTIKTASLAKQFRIYDKYQGTENMISPVTANGDQLYLCETGAMDGSKVVYQITPNAPVETKYGTIPGVFADSEKYPIAIFNNAGQFMAAKTELNSDSAENSAFMYAQANLGDNQTMIIYLRRNLTTTGTSTQTMAKVGKKSTLIVDLGGHTLTLGNHFFRSSSKDSANTYATQSIINGTINSGEYYVYAAGNFYNTKQFYVTFENIIFDNIKKAVIVSPLDQNATDNRYIANYYITLEECTFNVADSFSGNIFHLADSSKDATDFTRVSITMNGGTVNSNAKALLFKIVYSRFVNNSIHFGADKNGNYTTFNNAETALSSITPMAKADNNPLAIRKTGESSFTLVPFSFVSTYLNLAHDINVVYRVAIPALYTNPVATFTVGEDTVTVTEYTVDENGLYCFTLTAIAPHKMGDTVNVTVTATYGEAQETISNNQVSVKGYADALRAQYASDTNMLALLDALLVYGAAAQTYMNYNLDALVAEVGELNAIPEALITMAGESSAVANISACGLMLDGAFDLRVGITATSLEGLTLEITKGDKTTVVELTEDMKKGSYIVVYFDGLSITELDTEVTFTLKQNGVAVGKTLTFSANAYLYRMQNSENTALANLTKALYAYGEAAKAYNA